MRIKLINPTPRGGGGGSGQSFCVEYDAEAISIDGEMYSQEISRAQWLTKRIREIADCETKLRNYETAMILFEAAAIVEASK